MTSGTFSLSVIATGQGVGAAQGTAGFTVVPGPSFQKALQQALDLTYGTGTGMCSRIVCMPRTLAASASETLDLYAANTVYDVFGGGAGFAKIMALVIVRVANVSGADGTSVAVGGAGSNALLLNFADATDKFVVYSDGPPFVAGLISGHTVDNTHKNLLVTNLDASNSSSYILYAAGVSR